LDRIIYPKTVPIGTHVESGLTVSTLIINGETNNLYTYKEGNRMKSTILDARTVAVVRDLKVEKRQGINGEFESKDILVRIAVDRDYKVRRVENGKTIEEYPTDFWLAKFTGSVAQVFADHCTATKGDGKLQSRHLLLCGNFENYTNTRKVTKQVNIGGQLYEVEFEVENNQNTIFVVDSMKFLDKNPANATTQNNGGVVSVTPVASVAQPIAPATLPQPVQPVAQVAQPVAPVVQVAQPVQAVAQPVAPVVVPQPVEAQIMNPPVIDPNFAPTGQTAPF
jgi:hypothetical protein